MWSRPGSQGVKATTAAANLKHTNVAVPSFYPIIIYLGGPMLERLLPFLPYLYLEVSYLFAKGEMTDLQFISSAYVHIYLLSSKNTKA